MGFYCIREKLVDSDEQKLFFSWRNVTIFAIDAFSPAILFCFHLLLFGLWTMELYFQEQQEAAKKTAEAKRQTEKQRKKSELELVKQGKRPFYLKKCEYNFVPSLIVQYQWFL